VGKRLLTELLRLDAANLRQTALALEEYIQDSLDEEEALVLLGRAQVVSVLQRFIKGEISGEDLYVWADALELRPDVTFSEEDDDGEVFHAVSDISTTYVLRGPLTKEEAASSILALSTQS
jgi:hypothetical protein